MKEFQEILTVSIEWHFFSYLSDSKISVFRDFQVLPDQRVLLEKKFNSVNFQAFKLQVLVLVGWSLAGSGATSGVCRRSSEPVATSFPFYLELSLTMISLLIFFLAGLFVFSIHLTDWLIIRKFHCWWESNLWSLGSEVTTLPTVPQPMTSIYSLACYKITFSVFLIFQT